MMRKCYKICQNYASSPKISTNYEILYKRCKKKLPYNLFQKKKAKKIFSLYHTLLADFHFTVGGAVAQSVQHATPGEEVPGSIPVVAARSLLVGSVSV